MEINVVDTGDAALVKLVILLRNMNQEVIEMIPGADGVQRMVAQITEKVKTPKTLDVLRIYAHGNSGVINVAGGIFNAEDELSAISVSNLPKLETMLGRLTALFSPRARVELVGCDVALDGNKQITAGSDGERLLQQLAKLWHVNVLASGNPKEIPIGSLKFVGLVVQANPSGGLSCVPPQEVARIK